MVENLHNLSEDISVPTQETFERIIWSADVPGDVALAQKLRSIGDLPIRVKLDRLYARRYGDKAFDHLRLEGFEVFNDAKLIEIPSKLAELAKEEIKRTRPWMLNCMAGAISNSVGKAENRAELDGLKQFAEICLENDVLPCAVTVLTSKTDVVARNEFRASAEEQVLLYANWLVAFGFTDMVCSPKEAAAIRKVPGLNSLNLNTPGVRMPGDSAGDQARIATPGQAIMDGVNRVVIGRPITNSDDPAATIEAIARDIELPA